MNLALEDELIEDWLELGREGEQFLGHEAVLRSSGWAALLGCRRRVGQGKSRRRPKKNVARFLAPSPRWELARPRPRERRGSSLRPLVGRAASCFYRYKN